MTYHGDHRQEDKDPDYSGYPENIGVVLWFIAVVLLAVAFMVIVVTQF